MKSNVIASNPTIMKDENGKFRAIHADPSNGWKITKYEGLSYTEAAQLPFVNLSLLNLVK